jgi:hypothetical protein
MDTEKYDEKPRIRLIGVRSELRTGYVTNVPAFLKLVLLIFE